MPYEATTEQFIDRGTLRDIRLELLVEAAELAGLEPSTDVVATLPRLCGTGGFSPESAYVLEGMMWCNDLTADVAAFVRFARFNMDGFLDNYEWGRGEHSANLRDCARSIRGHYIDWRNRVTPTERAVCTLSVLYGLQDQFQEFYWTVSDKTTALLREGNQSVDDVDIGARLAATMLTTDRISHWCQDVEQSIAWLREDYAQADKRILLEFLRAHLNGQSIDGNTAQRAAVSTKRKIPRHKIKAVRQAVKRSSNMFRQIVGDTNLRDFVQGKRIMLEGTLFNYVIGKTQGIIDHTAAPGGCHIPYDLVVYEKDATEHLCRICVYFDTTPVLDQITALALYIKSDEEVALFDKANLFDRNEGFDQNLKMQQLGKTRSINAALTETVGAQITSALDSIDLQFDSILGVNGRVFREEIVPWRARLKEPIIAVASGMLGLGDNEFNSILKTDKRIDELVYATELPQTLQGFIDHYFGA